MNAITFLYVFFSTWPYTDKWFIQTGFLKGEQEKADHLKCHMFVCGQFIQTGFFNLKGEKEEKTQIIWPHTNMWMFVCGQFNQTGFLKGEKEEKAQIIWNVTCLCGQFIQTGFLKGVKEEEKNRSTEMSHVCVWSKR